MKTVGILTFHYANNHGAVLQAYALRRVINGLPDCKAELINYVPEGYVHDLHENSEIGVGLLEEKRRKFEAFLKNECGVCTPMISCVEGNKYDYYCVGSDQVWNVELAENADYEYFFPHLEDKAKRISYAASIGTEKEDIDKALFKRYLSKFQNILLREKSCIELINEITGIECKHVLDPTLLLEREDYAKLIQKLPCKPKVAKPYLLFFWYYSDELLKGVELANTIARKYGLAIVHTIAGARPYMFHNEYGCMMYAGVEEFLWYVKNASFVVTNSYHGSIFAMQFERPFYIHISQKRRSRLDTLVELCGLESRVVEGYIDASNITDKIDYIDIKRRVAKKRKDSMAFLKEALEIEEIAYE